MHFTVQLVFASAVVSAVMSLTCVNKQTAIAGGYRSTTNQGGATCTAAKWCMKITATTDAGKQTASTGINSKCAESSDENTCDTQAMNKCWETTIGDSKSEICCCNKDSCNDTPYKTGVEQVSAGAANVGTASAGAGSASAGSASSGSASSEPEPKGSKTAPTKLNGASATSASIGVLAIALARVFA